METCNLRGYAGTFCNWLYAKLFWFLLSSYGFMGSCSGVQSSIFHDFTGKVCS
jgi:hypothetical protein